MPFGAKTAPAVFQRLMDMVLRGLQWDRVVCYFDDILIGTSTWKEHWEQFESVLARLQRVGLRVKAAKVQLGKPEVAFRVTPSEMGCSSQTQRIGAPFRRYAHHRPRRKQSASMDFLAIIGSC